MQGDPCTHRNLNLRTAFTPTRPLSIANALDDSSYEEAPNAARYAAGVLLDDHNENGPLIQATLVGDGSPNKSQSPDFCVCQTVAKSEGAPLWPMVAEIGLNQQLHAGARADSAKHLWPNGGYLAWV